MRVLLVQNTLAAPALGGANTANRRLLADLAARGHACRVLAPASAPGGPVPTAAAFRRGVLATHGGSESDGIARFAIEGVEVAAVLAERGPVLAALARAVAREVVAFDPTWVIVAAEHDGSVCLRAAVAAAPGRVLALGHTVTGFPCGPQSAAPSEDETTLLRTVPVLTVSRFAADYLREWGRVEAHALPLNGFGPGPFADVGAEPGPFALVINPCAVKGIAILLALADRHPEIPFAAVPTWGTTTADRAALDARPNVTVLAPDDDVDRIYARARVLLVPSLWAETFGRCATEALLRGIPVLAADHGGLREAMCGAEGLLPVAPIEAFTGAFDDRRRAVPVVPAQDVGPWSEALARLWADPAHYRAVSRRGRAAAAEGVRAMSPDGVERFLLDREPAAAPAAVAEASPARATSDDLRALLALRAFRRRATSPTPSA